MSKFQDLYENHVVDLNKIKANRHSREMYEGDGGAEFREFMAAKIEGHTGTLEGEGKGLFSLNTESLQKLYKTILKSDAKSDYNKK